MIIIGSPKPSGKRLLVNGLPTHCHISAQVICYLQQQGHSFKLGRCDQILHQ